MEIGGMEITLTEGRTKAEKALSIILPLIFSISLIYFGTQLKCCDDKIVVCKYQLEKDTIKIGNLWTINLSQYNISNNGTDITATKEINMSDYGWR